MYLQCVGDHLVAHARTVGDPVDRDQFARSAFNRYYYAAFLKARELTRVWADNPDKRISHKDLPNHLRGRLRQQLKRALVQAQRKKVLNQQEYGRLLPAAERACKQLAKLLESAYNLRVVADYEPEVQVSDVNGVFVFSGIRVHDARIWPNESAACVDKIEEAIRHVRPD